MPRRPHIDWRLATRVAGPFSGPLPDAPRSQAQTVAPALRLAAARAAGLAVEFSGLPAGRGADEVLVVDRAGWARGAADMAATAINGLPLTERADGLRRRLGGFGYGLASGIALGVVSRHLLGQFDAFGGHRRLYLLGPNIVAAEQRHGFTPDDFRLWVALHEQTHAVQFSAAPWLADHLLARFVAVATDDHSALDAVRTVPQRGLGSLVASRRGHDLLDEVTAVMSLLEGHADYVSDAAGAVHIPSVATLRRAFDRSGSPSRWARLLPVADKQGQYRNGLRFCTTVAASVGAAGLARAFEGPGTLPTLHEIGNPRAWLGRVHGTA